VTVSLQSVRKTYLLSSYYQCNYSKSRRILQTATAASLDAHFKRYRDQNASSRFNLRVVQKSIIAILLSTYAYNCLAAEYNYDKSRSYSVLVFAASRINSLEVISFVCCYSRVDNTT
jgi:hypothetical protein